MNYSEDDTTTEDAETEDEQAGTVGKKKILQSRLNDFQFQLKYHEQHAAEELLNQELDRELEKYTSSKAHDDFNVIVREAREGSVFNCERKQCNEDTPILAPDPIHGSNAYCCAGLFCVVKHNRPAYKMV